MSASPRPAADPTLLQIRTLARSDAASIATFACGVPDLDEFLREDAVRLQEGHVAQTYLAIYASALAGYATLLADAVVLQTAERRRLRLLSDDHPVVPALKIARLAVAQAVKEQVRGIGEALVRFSLATALDLSQRAGCRLLTVDAKVGGDYTSLPFYEKLGFLPNRAKDYRDRQNPSMRLDVYGELGTWAQGI